MRMAVDESLQAIERLDASLDDEGESTEGETTGVITAEDEPRLPH
jgi:hypothetical protein